MQPNKVVLFTDGSVKPNPGFGGYGIFGYVYKDREKHKNTKHPIHNNLFFTPDGILKEKSEAIIEVTHILEVIHAVNDPKCTNNRAELLALVYAFDKASQIENLAELTIFTDSSYLVKMFNHELEAIRNNGWRRKDNKEAAYVSEWSILYVYKTTFAEKGIKVRVEWVNSHADNYGNNIADIYSAIGSNSAKQQIENTTTKFNKVVYESYCSYTDYKKSYLDKDIVFFFKDLYFSSSNLDDRTYCFLSSSDNPNIKGKRDTSSIFATNIGYVPEIINKFKALYRSINRDYISTCCLKLSKLEDKELYRLAHLLNIEDLLVKQVNGKVVTYSIIRDTQPFIFENTADYPFIVDMTRLFCRMLDIEEEHKTGNEFIITRDITDKIVQEGKIVFSNKDKSIDFTDVVSDAVHLKQKLIVTIGYDIPSYLALKNIEKEIQKVYLLLETKPDSNYCTLFINIVMANRSIYSVNIDNKYLRSIKQVVSK